MATMLQPFGGLLLVTLFTLGPVLGLMLLLNLRDRRRAAVLGAMWQRAPQDLRDCIAIEVRCAVLSRASVVAVDMRSCSRDEIWEAIARWCPGLPPHARLQVDGRMDRGLPATFTVEAACHPRPCCPPRATVAAG